MFTPIEELAPEVQDAVLSSLDAIEAWELTWDIGLTDPGDSYSVTPRWGARTVQGRWPAAFPVAGHTDPRTWRHESQAQGGHRYPSTVEEPCTAASGSPI